MERWCGGGWVALNVVGGPNITIRTGGDLELYITATISIFNIYMDLYINIQQREIFMENYIVVKCFAMLVCRQHTPFVFML